MKNTNPLRSGHTPSQRLHFGVSLVGPASELTFEQLRTLATTAERGVFSLMSLDARYWLREDPGVATATDPAGNNDVGTLLAALAAVTSNIGVAVAEAPNHDDAAAQIHRVASLDQLSGRRAAWNVLADGAENGDGGPHGDDGDIGLAAGRTDFLESALRLWEHRGVEGRRVPGPVQKVGAFERDGRLYSVGVGGLRQAPAQANPVLIHSADTAQERALAASHADIAITAPAGLVDALAVRRDLVARSLANDRGANDVKIMQQATFILAPSEAQAVEKADWIRAHLPDLAWDNHAFIGSYSDVAERLLEYVRSGAVDGFTIMPWLFPDELSEIVNHLVPRLQDRGMYPFDYASTTLRGNFGLPRSRRSHGSQGAQKLPTVDVADFEDVRLDVDLRMELIVQELQA